MFVTHFHLQLLKDKAQDGILTLSDALFQGNNPKSKNLDKLLFIKI